VGTEDPSTVGLRVRLRRVTVDDADLLERWKSVEYIGEFNDFGIQGRPLNEAIQESGLISGQGETLIVELLTNGNPIGTVSWRAVRYGPNLESVAWNIGISLIPEERGHGFGSEAQRLLSDHLFATTPVNRIEAATDIDNVAERRALEKAGFRHEGALRGAQYRAGRWRDLSMFARVRGTP
jgi:RimJ/RimL family protein N-acetyltransferase